MRFEPLPYQHARWVEGESFDAENVRCGTAASTCVVDVEGRPLVLFENDWAMRTTIEKNPELQFIAAVQPARRGSRAAA